MINYFNNNSILENLPKQPINKKLKTGIYLSMAVALIASGGCAWLIYQHQKLSKSTQLDLMANKKENTE